MPKISVIIPVYNTESFLTECLESIINQTHKNLEIICIDDGSKDNSFEILKNFQQKDSRIILLKNNTNLGAGKTRNKGLNIASGDYIHFMDSDDWLDLNAYETLIEQIKKTKTDIDILSFQLKHKTFDGKKNIKIRKHYDKTQLNRIININTENSLNFTWETFNSTKLYKTSFLLDNNLTYKNYIVGEDIYFCYKTLLKAESVYITNDAIYNYRNNPNSLGATKIKKPECMTEIFHDIFVLTKDYPTEIKDEICLKVFYYSFWSMWEGFLKRHISYNDLKNIIKTSLEKFSQEDLETIKSYHYFCYYNEILTKSCYFVCTKNLLRQILSRFFPYLNKYIIRIRKLISKK